MPTLTQPAAEIHPAVVACALPRTKGKLALLAENTPTDAAPPAPSPAVALRLPSRPDSPMTARHSLRELEGRVPPETMAKLRLLVTELVANSVRHARGTPIGVTVTLHEHALRAEVSDGGEGFDPPHPDPNPLKDAGWGLFLVRKIAERWGADQATGTVWFEIRTS